MIHPSSIIDASSTIGTDVEVGPFCVIGPNSHIGDGTKLHSSVTVLGHTTIGQRCTIFPHATIGAIAQHQGLWAPSEDARVLIGDDCLIRENVTIHRSTLDGDRPTKIGNRVLLMSGVHIAHDCIVEDDAVLVTGAGIAGHVTVGKKAIIAGMSGVTQCVTIGERAFVAAGSCVTRDVIPYSLVKGNRAKTIGVNVVGLRRAGWDDAKIRSVQDAVVAVVNDGIESLREMLVDSDSDEELKKVLAFCEQSEKGVCVRPGLQSTTIVNKL